MTPHSSGNLTCMSAKVHWLSVILFVRTGLWCCSCYFFHKLRCVLGSDGAQRSEGELRREWIHWDLTQGILRQWKPWQVLNTQCWNRLHLGKVKVLFYSKRCCLGNRRRSSVLSGKVQSRKRGRQICLVRESGCLRQYWRTIPTNVREGMKVGPRSQEEGLDRRSTCAYHG